MTVTSSLIPRRACARGLRASVTISAVSVAILYPAFGASGQGSPTPPETSWLSAAIEELRLSPFHATESALHLGDIDTYWNRGAERLAGPDGSLLASLDSIGSERQHPFKGPGIPDVLGPLQRHPTLLHSIWAWGVILGWHFRLRSWARPLVLHSAELGSVPLWPGRL